MSQRRLLLGQLDMSRLHYLTSVTLTTESRKQLILENPLQYKRVLLKLNIPTGASAAAPYLKVGDTVIGAATFTVSYQIIDIYFDEGVTQTQTYTRAQRDSWWGLSPLMHSIVDGTLQGDLFYFTNGDRNVDANIDIYVE